MASVLKLVGDTGQVVFKVICLLPAKIEAFPLVLVEQDEVLIYYSL